MAKHLYMLDDGILESFHNGVLYKQQDFYGHIGFLLFKKTKVFHKKPLNVILYKQKHIHYPKINFYIIFLPFSLNRLTMMGNFRSCEVKMTKQK